MDRPVEDRRREVRAAGPLVRRISALVRPGQWVLVLDLSPTGALVAALRPLRPGAVVHVHLASDGAKATLRAAVVRCLVAAMDAERMVYHAALRFEETSEWVRERQARLGSDFLEESASDDRGFENEIPGVEPPAALDSQSDAKWFEISPEM
jgi:PilZ domain